MTDIADINLRKLTQRAGELGVIKRGNFKLSSGQSSDYYVDGRLLSMDPVGAALLGRIFSKRLSAVKSVGGPAIGAVPIVTATIVAAHYLQKDIKGFFVRSASKGHGRKQLIEGYLTSPVAILDDTCTTGQSIMLIVKLLESKNVEIEQILTIFDRGGGQNILDAGYKYSALLSVVDGSLEPWQ